MEEKVFYEGGGTSVTSSKIVIGGNTYATRNVGSVRTENVDAPIWPKLVLVIGLIICMQSFLFGLLVAGAGVAGIMTNKAKVKLLLMAGGGESLAIESEEHDFVKKLHAAIVEAISAR